jgi:hypothetical protein
LCCFVAGERRLKRIYRIVAADHHHVNGIDRQ